MQGLERLCKEKDRAPLKEKGQNLKGQTTMRLSAVLSVVQKLICSLKGKPKTN